MVGVDGTNEIGISGASRSMLRPFGELPVPHSGLPAIVSSEHFQWTVRILAHMNLFVAAVYCAKHKAEISSRAAAATPVRSASSGPHCGMRVCTATGRFAG